MPKKGSFFGNSTVRVVSRAETLVVHIDDDELSHHPSRYLFLRLASIIEGAVVAPQEEQSELPGSRRVVVTLHLDLFTIQTDKLSVVLL